jgi:diguanylate cyclase (GGDEF)-like protein
MFGSDYRECWASAWPAVGEAFDLARGGQTAFLEDQAMFLDRNGYLEETWFTFSLSPIRGERGEVAGLFLPVTETTVRMLSERRTLALRDLSDRTHGARSAAEAVGGTIEVLAEGALDVPFALIYRVDGDHGEASLLGQVGVELGSPLAVPRIGLDEDSPLAVAIRDQRSVMVDDLVGRYGRVCVADREEPLQRALVLPIVAPGADSATGALVLGISTRLPLDDAYLGFLNLIAQGVTSALTSADAREQERARAESLAALDRAKTEFFSNVSHEFRTPLTLILGPLEDALAKGIGTNEDREQLEMVHRNGLRLIRMVNSLLDFSRIESGRLQASFVPTDLATLTLDAAGSFAYAFAEAGIMFSVDCPPLPEPVFVDRDMWERIVLNLLSNAFKHTFAGEVAVSLRWVRDGAELTVRDSGIGIPREELPQLFDRFHRVRGARSRTIEGTGIGLALVQELAACHGGTVSVESEEGHGTTFTVTVASGSAHLPSDQVGEGAEGAAIVGTAAAYADEALSWLAASDPPVWNDIEAHQQAGPRSRLLIADDNADMRRHLARLLEPTYEVTVTADGASALEAALTNPPDLILTDVMMPRLDGLELLTALREEHRTRTIPVIMLSARAGQEASAGAIRAGVDDYLAKPFSAQELLSRVSGSLEMARLRRESERELAAVNHELEQALSRLEVLATTDTLTGLPNRRKWDEEIVREIARATRNEQPLCVAMLDIDDFKTYNDTCGHQAGDALLSEAGAAWGTALRVSDLIARFGGDEFAVLMPDCSLDNARVVMQRVGRATPGGQSSSAGIACWNGHESADALIARADEALYAAKRARATSEVASDYPPITATG